ncbi:MAG: hypothetical protein GXY55_06920 [Phycisphaerae bacterium]|nr:hypothetical protein [Phycisphaerae bacterium]
MTIRVGNTRARGAVLLEVVLSFGLLLMGMVLVGLQIRAGLDAADSTNLGTQAVMLTDTIIAELDAGVISLEATDDEIKGDFGVKAPGYTWRIRADRADVDDLYMLTLDIGFNRSEVENQINDPALEIDIEDEGTRIIRTAYRLHLTPADVNVERDFGLSPEEIEGLVGDGSTTGGIAGAGDAAGSGDAGGSTANAGANTAISEALSRLGELGVDTSILSYLTDPSGFDPRILSTLPEEEFLGLATVLEMMLGAGATGDDELGSLLAGNLLGGREGRGGRGGRGRGRPGEGGPPGRGPGGERGDDMGEGGPPRRPGAGDTAAQRNADRAAGRSTDRPGAERRGPRRNDEGDDGGPGFDRGEEGDGRGPGFDRGDEGDGRGPGPRRGEEGDDDRGSDRRGAAPRSRR